MIKEMKERTQETTDVRQALLDSAASLFGEQGYSNTGVQYIADGAGVTKAMLYYYFNSKESLYCELIDKGVALMEGAVASAEQPGGGIEGRLRRFLTTYLTIAVEHPDLARILYREAMRMDDSAGPTTVADYHRASVKRLAAILADAQPAGHIRRDIDPVIAAYSLFGMANMFISRYIATRQSLDIATLVNHTIALYLEGTAGDKNPHMG